MAVEMFLLVLDDFPHSDPFCTALYILESKIAPRNSVSHAPTLRFILLEVY